MSKLFKIYRLVFNTLNFFALIVVFHPNLPAQPQILTDKKIDKKTIPYLALDLDYSPYKKIYSDLMAQVGPLKSRNEAHITIITPPEFKTLLSPESHLTVDKALDLYNNWITEHKNFKRICLGKYSKTIKGKEQSTYYIVVESSDLLNLRRLLAKNSGLSKDKFDPELFYPHITIGFTDKDLHYEDGAVKNHTSCTNIPVQYEQ